MVKNLTPQKYLSIPASHSRKPIYSLNDRACNKKNRKNLIYRTASGQLSTPSWLTEAKSTATNPSGHYSCHHSKPPSPAREIMRSHAAKFMLSFESFLLSFSNMISPEFQKLSWNQLISPDEREIYLSLTLTAISRCWKWINTDSL